MLVVAWKLPTWRTKFERWSQSVAIDPMGYPVAAGDADRLFVREPKGYGLFVRESNAQYRLAVIDVPARRILTTTEFADAVALPSTPTGSAFLLRYESPDVVVTPVRRSAALGSPVRVRMPSPFGPEDWSWLASGESIVGLGRRALTRIDGGAAKVAYFERDVAVGSFGVDWQAAGDLLLVSTGLPSFVDHLFDLRDGRQLSTFNGVAALLPNGEAYFRIIDGELRRLSPDGTIVWSRTLSAGANYLSVSETLVAAAHRDGLTTRVETFRTVDGSVAMPEISARWANLEMSGNSLVFTNEASDTLYSMDLRSGGKTQVLHRGSLKDAPEGCRDEPEVPHGWCHIIPSFGTVGRVALVADDHRLFLYPTSE